ncbi:MAG: CsgG/HfaB family protein [bacterium]
MNLNKRVWVVVILLLLGISSASCGPGRQSMPIANGLAAGKGAATEKGNAIEKGITIEKGTAAAVWDFDDLSPSAGDRPPLGELLSAQVMEVLASSGDVVVIERERLHLALEELKLGTTSLADEATRLQLGRLAGARLMVFGAYQSIAGTMRLDLRLVEVETGRVLKAVKRAASSADFSAWLKAAREAAADLL